jgi:hypothetical protein
LISSCRLKPASFQNNWGQINKAKLTNRGQVN